MAQLLIFSTMENIDPYKKSAQNKIHKNKFVKLHA